MSLKIQKDIIIKQIELVQDADLLNSIQSILKFGLKLQVHEDIVVSKETQEIVQKRLEEYHENPNDVADFDDLLYELEKSI
ncbi:MAG: hypothetical protein R2801_06730 [Chitinophagales bacterium]